MVITANTTYYKQLNEQIRECPDADITVKEIYGQRYIGCGTSGKHIKLYGTPGNGLGQYNDGSVIEVFGNCQEDYHSRQLRRRLRIRNARRTHLH